jgi:alanine-synthesizing transaminase
VFSSRLNWDLRPNPLTTLLEQKRAAGAQIIDLTESNPTRAGFAYPTAEILSALADPRAIRYDPSPRGLPSAREAISNYYANRGAGDLVTFHPTQALFRGSGDLVTCHPNQILLTASTSEAYSYLFKLLCDPGDEILTPRPSYPLFEFLAALDSVRIRQYPLRYDGAWHIDFPALEAAITPRTRAIVVVNPNNPTGSFLKPDEFARLQSLAIRSASSPMRQLGAIQPVASSPPNPTHQGGDSMSDIHPSNPTREGGASNDAVQSSSSPTHQDGDPNIAILLDEVFSDYHFAAPRPAPPAPKTLTFSMSGLSKIAGLPQMKLGWIVAQGPGHELALDRLELIADTYLSVATPVQLALPRLLAACETIRAQILDRAQSNLARLRSLTAGTACHVLNVEGGWSAILQVPRARTEEQWALTLLADHDVLVQPGFFFDFESEAFLVVSLITPPEIFEEGIWRILRLVQ